MCTWKAASYQPGTVNEWAKDIAARNLEIRGTKRKPVITDMEKALDLLFDDGGEVTTQVHLPRGRKPTDGCQSMLRSA